MMRERYTNKRLHKQGRVKNPSKAVSDMAELLEYLTQIITQVKKWGPSKIAENSDTCRFEHSEAQSHQLSAEGISKLDSL